MKLQECLISSKPEFFSQLAISFLLADDITSSISPIIS